MIRKNGSTVYVAFDGMIGYDDRHSFVQTYCNLNDITEQHKAQLRLKESEENLKLAQAITKIGSWELSPNNNTLLLSDEAKNLFEITEADGHMDRAEIENLVDPSDRQMVVEALDNLINKNAPYNIVYKVHKKKETLNTSIQRLHYLRTPIICPSRLSELYGISQMKKTNSWNLSTAVITII